MFLFFCQCTQSDAEGLLLHHADFFALFIVLKRHVLATIAKHTRSTKRAILTFCAKPAIHAFFTFNATLTILTIRAIYTIDTISAID